MDDLARCGRKEIRQEGHAGAGDGTRVLDVPAERLLSKSRPTMLPPPAMSGRHATASDFNE
jgi:hypothetical protein